MAVLPAKVATFFPGVSQIDEEWTFHELHIRKDYICPEYRLSHCNFIERLLSWPRDPIKKSYQLTTKRVTTKFVYIARSPKK